MKDLRTSPVYEHTREKKVALFDPQRVNLLGEDSIFCMVKLLETPGVIVFFFLLHDCLPRVFQKRSFVLSTQHENQSVATIGTLLNHFMLTCK